MKSTPKCGILFAATGPEYLRLAVRAARTARTANPGIAIDIATDQPDPPEVFDEVRPLAPGVRHPKLHAMPETRFEQTLFLDADLFVLANIEDVFFLLDRFDIAMAHTPSRSSRNARDTWRREFTNAYPQFNSGVMAYRRTEPVLALLRNWGDMVLTSNAKKDQPCLRELLWESDLRVATLPLEFNLMNPKMLGAWPKDHAAPRILHNGKFHSNVAGRPTVGSLPELLGPTLTRKLNRVLRSDTEIRNKALIRLTASDVGRYWRRRLLRKLHRWLRPRRVR